MMWHNSARAECQVTRWRISYVVHETGWAVMFSIEVWKPTTLHQICAKFPYINAQKSTDKYRYR